MEYIFLFNAICYFNNEPKFSNYHEKANSCFTGEMIFNNQRSLNLNQNKRHEYAFLYFIFKRFIATHKHEFQLIID